MKKAGHHKDKIRTMFLNKEIIILKMKTRFVIAQIFIVLFVLFVICTETYLRTLKTVFSLLQPQGLVQKNNLVVGNSTKKRPRILSTRLKCAQSISWMNILLNLWWYENSLMLFLHLKKNRSFIKSVLELWQSSFFMPLHYVGIDLDQSWVQWLTISLTPTKT